MPSPRFYYPDKLVLHQSFKLPANLTHYAMRVLRLKNGVDVILFDNYGGQYIASLDIQGKDFYVVPYEHQAIECELAGQISLFQGIAAGDKMDWIIEKSVELGVYEFFPISTDRSVTKLNAERQNKRLGHWQAVAISASEQSGRNRIMQVHKPISLAQAMQYKHDLSLFCHPEGAQDLTKLLNRTKDQQATNAHKQLDIFIGPEGGWSNDELSIAKNNNLQTIKFGTRVLRTETAGLAVVTASSVLMGWH